MSDLDVERDEFAAIEFAPQLPRVIEPLGFEPLETFAAVDEPGAEALVTHRDHPGAVLAVGSLAMVYGDGGAGKTTLLIDQAIHFAAGVPWCDVLTPTRPLQVAWIENEGPRPMMRLKFRRKLAAWEGPALDGRLQILSVPWAEFSFKQELHRDQLAEVLEGMRADLLIVGPLASIGMEGGGTNDQIGAFLDLVRPVQQACATAPAVLLVHHENRAGQVSGAWEQRPDTFVQVQGQGHGRTRVFWQKVRWCSALHATSTHLVWSDNEGFLAEEKPEVTADTIADGIRAAVLELPGGSWSKIRATVTGNEEEKAKVRDRLLTAGEIVNSATRDGYFNLWAADDPAVTRSEPGTARERPLFPSPDGTVEPSRSPVPDVSRNGERNGTAEPGRTAAGTDEHQQMGIG